MKGKTLITVDSEKKAQTALESGITFFPYSSGDKWILLKVKPPCNPSPPKLAIMWSRPWPERNYADEQRMYVEAGAIEQLHDTYASIFPRTEEHDWAGARAIFYKGEKIRVFPDEFSVVSDFEPYREEYLWIPDSEMEKSLVEMRLSKGRREIFDAALIDGCTDVEATIVALGGDPTSNASPPPVGWWKPSDPISAIFCTVEESRL